MINLEHMDLSHNLLAELPLSINELRKLETLDVRNCHLRYLPYTMNDLRNTLREVIVSIVHIPHSCIVSTAYLFSALDKPILAKPKTPYPKP